MMSTAVMLPNAAEWRSARKTKPIRLDMAQHWFAKSEQQSVEEKFDAADKNS